MDGPADIEARLAQAERYVAEGAARIERQREIQAELARDGHARAAIEAEVLLEQFMALQALFVSDRDRYRDELANETD